MGETISSESKHHTQDGSRPDTNNGRGTLHLHRSLLLKREACSIVSFAAETRHSPRGRPQFRQLRLVQLPVASRAIQL